MDVIPPRLLLPPLTQSGAGSIRKLLPDARAFGARALLVHGRSLQQSGFLDTILATRPADLNVQPYLLPEGEPAVDSVEALRSAARAHRADWIAGIGGGSVLDAAKACAGLLHAPLAVADYHNGEPIPPSGTPFIAAPTTAGTGSEATSVCVLTRAVDALKKSIRHDSFIARQVVLDPDLLDTCPPRVIADAGMDALTQAIESFISRGATWLSDQFAIEAIRAINSSIEGVYARHRERNTMALLQGSFLAGIALANARLGLVHGLAHPLGALYHLPHGRVCAACLIPVLTFNAPVITQKYAAISHLIGGDLLERLASLQHKLNLENPFKTITLHDVPRIIEETLASGSTQANPRPVHAEDVTLILKNIFHDTG